ncbi:hypothetical protein NP233_g11367 [Leucocoprinus birnbaumii]|uniref:Hydrophobin n=1 Tax=Leucocoprinus birnbaumii TaxID=56174 RepID=A0AAD5YR10_9AGAR|nr:hypothetical protein NP233_g11367 [Leucocoprinus birnbaumii]
MIANNASSHHTANGDYSVLSPVPDPRRLVSVTNDGASNLVITLTPTTTVRVFRAENKLPSKVTVKREDEVSTNQSVTSGAEGQYTIETTESPPRRLCKLTVTRDAQTKVSIFAPTAKTMRSAILFAVLPAALVSAEFVARGDGYGDGSTGGSCNTGSVQCCNSVQDASSEGVSQLTGLLGIALGPITGLIGCKSRIRILWRTTTHR